MPNVGGKAELMVQDAKTNQELLARFREVQTAELLRARLECARAGHIGRRLEDAIAELGTKGAR